jgi:hypothetical protein
MLTTAQKIQIQHNLLKFFASFYVTFIILTEERSKSIFAINRIANKSKMCCNYSMLAFDCVNFGANFLLIKCKTLFY